MKTDNALRWLAFSIIAAAVVIFYFPSLFFPPRADQVIYLSETSAKQNPWDLIIGSYDHNRHRTIAPGDELLFRPLLYAFLGIEQVLFGHKFWAWQLTGLVCHLILIWVLLRLLWHLSGPWLAFAGTWLFALAVFNYEMVTWPHLSSYMLMMACVLASIEQMVLCLEEGRFSGPRLGRLLIYFFIAVFIYETANIFALLIIGGLLISFPKQRRSVLLLALPVVIYAASSCLNYILVGHTQAEAQAHLHASIFWYGREVFYTTLWWFYEGIFNGLYHYILAMRTMFVPSDILNFKPLVFSNPQVMVTLALGVIYLALAWRARDKFRKSKVLGLLIGMVLSYVAVIVIGRYQETTTFAETIGINSYYAYLFWALVTVIGFLLLPYDMAKTKAAHLLVGGFVAVSLVLGIGEGRNIFGMATAYSRQTNDTLLLITTLDLLIKEKKSQPHFSFYVDTHYPGNYPYGDIRKINDPPSRKYTFAEFMYPQYFQPRETALYKFLERK